MDSAVICPVSHSTPSLIEVILFRTIPACKEPVGDNEERPIPVV